MWSLFRTLSFRYLRQRRGRALLIVASIALGVAAVVATRVLNQSMAHAAQGATNPLAGTADLMIFNGEAGVPHALVKELTDAHIAGLKSVRPLVIGRVSLRDLKDRLGWLLGVDYDGATGESGGLGFELHLNTQSTASVLLGLARGRRPVVVGSTLAAELEAASGQHETVRVRASGEEYPLLLVGTLSSRAESPAAALGRNILLMRTDDAAALQFARGAALLTRIDLALDPDADPAEVTRHVEELVHGRAAVKTPKAVDDSIREVTAGLELGFDLGGAGALVVGLFLVYNALSVTVAERRHDIGILRSVGATRRQVAGLFAGEAALLGLVGAALGVPLGVGLAYGALGPVQKILSDIFLPLEADRVRVSTTLVVGAVLAGIATSLLAALVPAIQASQEEPADAVRRVPRTVPWVYRLLQAAGSAAQILAGLACIGFSDVLTRAGLPRYGTFGGLVFILVGAMTASPLVSALLSRLLQPLVRQLLGIEGRLAADNLTRSAGRAGLVIGSLAAVVALMLQSAGVSLSMERAFLFWIDDRIAADFFVTSNASLTGGGEVLSVRDEVTQQMRDDPELARYVEEVVPIRAHQLDLQGKKPFLLAFDAGRAFDAISRRPPVTGLEFYPRLRDEPGTALVSENFAALYNKRVGDTVTVEGGRDGLVEFTIIGVVLDYTWNRGTLITDREFYLRHFDDHLVDLFHIYLRPGADPTAARDLIVRKWGAEQGLVVVTRDELREGLRNLLQRLNSIAIAQELVIGLVAVLGVVTALLISVLQRRRELGLLRAVGASRSQVLRSVLAEAVLMSLIGSVIGVLIGVPLEWYVLNVLMRDEAGFVFPLHIPWLAAGVVIGLTLVAAAVAGLGPALHAVHLRIAEAIAYE